MAESVESVIMCVTIREVLAALCMVGLSSARSIVYSAVEVDGGLFNAVSELERAMRSGVLSSGGSGRAT